MIAFTDISPPDEISKARDRNSRKGIVAKATKEV